MDEAELREATRSLLGRASVELRVEELRVEGDEVPAVVPVRGVASRTEVWYDVYGGPDRGGWREMVERGAFSATLTGQPDVVLLSEHQGLNLARTISSTLRVSEDETGLVYRADLDGEVPAVAHIYSGLRRGDITESSFAFRVMRQEWNGDYSERRIREVDLDRGDVSIVNFGANEFTSAELAMRSAVADHRRHLTDAEAATRAAAADRSRANRRSIRSARLSGAYAALRRGN